MPLGYDTDQAFRSFGARTGTRTLFGQTSAGPADDRRATPAVAYQARPKATPAAGRDHHTHDRVRRDRIDTDGKVTLRVNGRLHHIGIGPTHARTPVLLLVQDLHVRIVNAATGELLRQLLIDPTRDYQPIHPPPTNTTSPRTHTAGSG